MRGHEFANSMGGLQAWILSHGEEQLSPPSSFSDGTFISLEFGPSPFRQNLDRGIRARTDLPHPSYLLARNFESCEDGA